MLRTRNNAVVCAHAEKRLYDLCNKPQRIDKKLCNTLVRKERAQTAYVASKGVSEINASDRHGIMGLGNGTASSRPRLELLVHFAIPSSVSKRVLS